MAQEVAERKLGLKDDQAGTQTGFVGQAEMADYLAEEVRWVVAAEAYPDLGSEKSSYHP